MKRNVTALTGFITLMMTIGFFVKDKAYLEELSETTRVPTTTLEQTEPDIYYDGLDDEDPLNNDSGARIYDKEEDSYDDMMNKVAQYYRDDER